MAPNLQKGIHETTEFLELFLRNLLLNENNELHNRSMHVRELFKDFSKATITSFMRFMNQQVELNVKNQEHIRKLYEKFGTGTILGRSDVQAVTGLGGTRAYELLKILLNIRAICPVSGHGKGKYKFGV